MSKEESRIIVTTSADTDEWPMPVLQQFHILDETAHKNNFSMVCAVGVNFTGEQHVSVMFTPSASQNPHLLDMVTDIIEMFQLMAKRLKQ